MFLVDIDNKKMVRRLSENAFDEEETEDPNDISLIDPFVCVEMIKAIDGLNIYKLEYI